MTGGKWTTEGDGQRRARVRWTALDRAVLAVVALLWLALVGVCGVVGCGLWTLCGR